MRQLRKVARSVWVDAAKQLVHTPRVHLVELRLLQFSSIRHLRHQAYRYCDLYLYICVYVYMASSGYTLGMVMRVLCRGTARRHQPRLRAP